jgi:ADP-dependent phosphofructokinase/glucokinase
MEREWKSLRTESSKHKFHVEFGHFSSKESFAVFEKYAVSNTDSLGMNELELTMLLDFWKGQLHDINSKGNSQPSLDVVIK